MIRKTNATALILILIFCIFALFHSQENNACTTAIINGDGSVEGYPMLWKNRDTDFLSNKVIYVSNSPYSYVALINSEDASGRWAYSGLNSEGFGIMNSVAYNLPKNESEMKDLEGNIMAEALRTCRTVEDFENFLNKNIGPSLGCWANFGVIDASGNSVEFEVHNNGFKKYNAAEAPERYLVYSNFSRSGEEGKGVGYIRFERASQLFKDIPGKKPSHGYILNYIARDFGHSMVKHPTWEELSGCSESDKVWIATRDTISRPSTACAAVICGRKPKVDKSVVNNFATFWINLGEPVTSIAVPVWVEAKDTPSALRGGKNAPICEESLRIKKLIHPYTESDRETYMLGTRLLNKEKTGFLPLLLETEKEILAETERFLSSKVKLTSADLAAFQNKMAEKALKVLKGIK